jgi:hypothetical protein
MDTACLTNGQGRSTTLTYEIWTMWETNPRTTPQKTSWLLMGPEQVTRPKTLQSIWWWLIMMILCHCFLKSDLLEVHLVLSNEALVTELWWYNPFNSHVFKMLSYCSKTSYHLAIKYGGGTADGGTVVKVLCYNSEGRWFDSRWCHWNFSLT